MFFKSSPRVLEFSKRPRTQRGSTRILPLWPPKMSLVLLRNLGLLSSTGFSQPTCVDDRLDHSGHLAFEHRVEQFDQHDKAGAQHNQRASQQHEAHCQIWQRGVHKQMIAWGWGERSSMDQAKSKECLGPHLTNLALPVLTNEPS